MPQHFYPMWAPDPIEPRVPRWVWLLLVALIIGTIIIGGGFIIWYEANGRPWWQT